MPINLIELILSLLAILIGGFAVFKELFTCHEVFWVKRKDGNQWVEIADFPNKKQLEDLRNTLAEETGHRQSTANIVKKVNLQIWISASIIGFANFIPLPAVQGLISLGSIFMTQILTKWLNERRVARQRKKLKFILEDEIIFVGHLLPSAPEPRRSQLQKQLSDYHKILSDNSADMFDFETPSSIKKSAPWLWEYPQTVIETLKSRSFQLFSTDSIS